jgi:hypothetical protein
MKHAWNSVSVYICAALSLKNLLNIVLTGCFARKSLNIKC